jgi:antitoxin CptB
MGRFADSTIDALNENELAEFERLIEMPDREVLAWITGECEVPRPLDSALLRRLREFHFARRCDRP